MQIYVAGGLEQQTCRSSNVGPRSFYDSCGLVPLLKQLSTYCGVLPSKPASVVAVHVVFFLGWTELVGQPQDGLQATQQRSGLSLRSTGLCVDFAYILFLIKKNLISRLFCNTQPYFLFFYYNKH